MAFGLNRWMAYLGLCLLVAATWALPPRHNSWSYSRLEQTPERALAVDLLGAAFALDLHHQRLQRRDSLSALVLEAFRKGQAAPVGRAHHLVEDSIARVRELFLEEVERVSGGDPKVATGLFLYDPMAWRHPGLEGLNYLSYRYYRNREIFAGTEAGAEFCLLTHPVFPSYNRDWDRYLVWSYPGSGGTNMLGPCAFHLRYGSPGPHVFEWMKSRGYSFAQEFQSFDATAFERQRADMFRYYSVWMAFGGRNQFRYDVGTEGERCATGDRDACLGIVWRPERTAGGELFAARLGISPEEVQRPVAYYRGQYWSVQYGRYSVWSYGAGTSLLSEIEQTLGPERFAQFWTSDLEVPEAFEAASGVPLDLWIMEWYQERLGTLDPGPHVPLQANLLSLLFVGVLVGLVGIVGQRRAMGR